MIRNWSIRNRVLLLALLPVISLGVLLSSYFVQSRVHDLKDAQATLGRTMADQLASASLYGMLTHNPEALHALAKSGIREPNVQSITITAGTGEVMAQVNRPPQPGDSFTAVLARRIGAQTGFAGALVFTRPIVRTGPLAAGSQPSAALQLGSVTVKLSEVHFAERQARIIMSGALILLVCLAFSILLALIISGSVVAPIERVIGVVRRFTSGDHRARVTEHSGGELRQLEQGINQMAASAERSQQQLQDQVDQATAELRGTLEEFEVKSVELDLARKRALEANRVKAEFLANMSHEIRTPMNAVLGFSDLLTRTPLDEGQRGYLATIQQSAHTLLALLDNILDASRLEMSTLDIHNSAFVPRELLEETLRAHAIGAYAKQIELVLDSDGYDAQPLLGDRIKLMRVLTNLVSNAVKFTAAGSVVLRSHSQASSDGRVQLTLEISDTGIGISAADQHRLFQPFSQVHSAADRRHEGAGLGLFISKRLVNLMGGTLTLHSVAGEGSQFRVTLVLAPAADHAGEPGERALAPAHGTLLAYEPNNPAAQALQARLARLGWSADMAASLPALHAYLDAHNVGRYRGAILALGYPDLRDPGEFAAALPASVRRLPRLALVNSVNAEIQAGIGRLLGADCQPKILSESRLGECLERMRDAKPGALPSLPPTETSLLDGHTIAVADDNRINRLLERILLEKYGARVLEARTGQELVALVEHQPVSLILLDMQMPGEDGWQVAARLRSGLAGQLAIPVIALSAMGTDKSAAELAAAGLSGWLMKPLEESALCAAVARHLRKAPAAGRDPLSTGEKPGLLTAALQRLRPEVRQMLRADLPEQQRAIDSAWSQHDLAGLRQQVHKLNGTAAFCGFPELRATCTQLENQLRQGNAANIADLIGQLRQQAGEIIRCLDHAEISAALPS